MASETAQERRCGDLRAERGLWVVQAGKRQRMASNRREHLPQVAARPSPGLRRTGEFAGIAIWPTVLTEIWNKRRNDPEWRVAVNAKKAGLKPNKWRNDPEWRVKENAKKAGWTHTPEGRAYVLTYNSRVGYPNHAPIPLGWYDGQLVRQRNCCAQGAAVPSPRTTLPRWTTSCPGSTGVTNDPANLSLIHQRLGWRLCRGARYTLITRHCAQGDRNAAVGAARSPAELSANLIRRSPLSMADFTPSPPARCPKVAHRRRRDPRCLSSWCWLPWRLSAPSV